MSHATSEQPAPTPAKSRNPLSASEHWNLVADGYTETTIRVFAQFADEAVSAIFSNMTTGSAPIQMMKKGLGEELWREKERLAMAWLEETLPALKGSLTADAWLGVGVKW